MTDVTQIRGYRNNNPGNIRLSSDKWQGLALEQTDKEFFQFKDVTYGIRALARVLIRYQDSYKLTTAKDFITRYAPPSENNTDAYVAAILKWTGFQADQRINVHTYCDLEALVKAIINFELSVQPYTDAQIAKGLVLAGVEPAKQPLSQTSTVKGQQVVAVGVVLSGVMDSLNGVKDQIEPLIPYADTLKYVFLVISLVGVAYTVWQRFDARRKGIA